MIELSKPVFGIILALLLVLVVLELRKWDRDADNRFRFQDLLLKDGKASISKCGQFCALCVSTWAFVYLTIADRLTEWYFTFFMTIWATAKGADKALDIWASKGDKK